MVGNPSGSFKRKAIRAVITRNLQLEGFKFQLEGIRVVDLRQAELDELGPASNVVLEEGLHLLRVTCTVN